MSGQSCVGIAQGHAVGSFKNLDDSFVLINLNNTADLASPVVHVKFYDFLIGGILDTFQDHQRSVYFA